MMKKAPTAILLLGAVFLLVLCSRVVAPAFSSLHDAPLSSSATCIPAVVRTWIHSSPTVIVATTTKPSFRISLHSEAYDPLRWPITQKGHYYDTFLTEMTRRLLESRPTGVVVDVGANIGWLSLYSMALGHKVHSFEPNSRNVARLCQSVAENNFESLSRIHHAGVGDRIGTLKLQQPENPGAAKVWSNHSSKRVTYEEAVDIVTLASELHEDALLLKVDVEGYEGHVLRGARAWLQKYYVGAIYVELNPRLLVQQGLSTATVVEEVIALGYRVHFATFARPRTNVPQSPREIADRCNEKIQCDLLFCRNGDICNEMQL